jgi:hypothetical protein
MGTGMDFEEFCELKLTPRAGADQAFFEAAEQEREAMFPMPPLAVVNHLRSRGYDCRAESLELLVENGVVRPASLAGWSQAEVDAAADYFEDCGIFTPYASMCETLGCRYADFVRALREAAERESRAYGQQIPADDQYFVMHRTPPRGVTDPDGNLVDIQPAVISFTLADDIRERLERGEEV